MPLSVDSPGATAARIIDNVEKVVVGKRDAVTLVLVALLAEGHVLLEDVPGVGKTLLAKAVARSLALDFRRVQCTPDLLPSDVTGLNVLDPQTGAFRWLPGPVTANVLLADEINRATPRTQSCLLEAMEERQVTVDGETRRLPRPFVVLATQNPIEHEGTFPLPEAQLDRFLVRVRQGYPSAEDEEAILIRYAGVSPLDKLESVAGRDELATLQARVRAVAVEDTVRGYIVRIVRETRSDPSVRLGASPRATRQLYQAAQALAMIRERDYVLPDDVKELAVPVLAHRLVLGSEARLRGAGAESVIAAILERVPVPVE